MTQTTFVDYYRTLRVSSDATAQELRLAYLRQAKRQHPDMGGSVAAMRHLNQAYETLRNPAKRHEYDQFYKRYGSDKGLMQSDDFDIEEVDIFLHEVYQQEQRKKWLNPLVMALSVAGLAVLLFVVVAVGRMVTSSGSAQAAQAPPAHRIRK